MFEPILLLFIDGFMPRKEWEPSTGLWRALALKRIHQHFLLTLWNRSIYLIIENKGNHTMAHSSRRSLYVHWQSIQEVKF
jgi:hypothetical protein